MTTPATLRREVSPPPLRRVSTIQAASPEQHETNDLEKDDKSEPAAIEAGETGIRDHLSYFVHHLSTVSRKIRDLPRISLPEFENLYQRNQHRHGTHYVIHQHNHPISGTHYDLRLQFSESSTLSFAIPYGLPGNPNSVRPIRMAIETRVHNLWNNLTESASHATGSLLIWDTGEYEVLPRKAPKTQKMTDDEMSDTEQTEVDRDSHSGKLVKGFQSRHIRLRLHGTRLPKNYTVALRLPLANDRAAQPKKPKRKRRRLDPTNVASKQALTSSDEESDSTVATMESAELPNDVGFEAALASEDEDASIRANNAYTGAANTIGSIHQRHWFLTLDRSYSGFRKARDGSDAGRWVGDWEAFFVQGRDHERSVVTGRLSDDVLADEGVKDFVERKMWRPIIE